MVDERESDTQSTSDCPDSPVNPDIQIDRPDGTSIKIDFDFPEWILVIALAVLCSTGYIVL
jgi:hypothetical protein